MKLKEKGSLTFQSSHRKKNGHEFPVEITSNYVEFEGEEYNCAFARDITERRRAEHAQAALLKVSEMASRTENLESLLRTVRRQFGTLIDTRNFYVALFDPPFSNMARRSSADSGRHHRRPGSSKLPRQTRVQPIRRGSAEVGGRPDSARD